LKRRLAVLKMKTKRIIVGIETGNTPGQWAAAMVEVSGNGDDTVLYLKNFYSYRLPAELVTTFSALDNREKFDLEELAGINFLVLHHLSKLYQEVIAGVDIDPDKVDLIGLKCLEINGMAFPNEPSALSEITGLIVASRFYIGVEDSAGNVLPVKESLLKGMVGDMIDKFGLESEVREAVAVALLANESLFHESSDIFGAKGRGSTEKKRPSLKAIKRTGAKAGKENACLCGEFFFPA
jgi:hypothetical protein